MEMEVEMMMTMAAVRIMLMPVDAPARLGATVTGPARRPDVLTAQFASNIPATLPWPYSRCLDFLRTEKRLAARAPQTAGRYLSPATLLGQAPTRGATPVGPSAGCAARMRAVILVGLERAESWSVVVLPPAPRREQ
jgi:hypothetical protein